MQSVISTLSLSNDQNLATICKAISPERKWSDLILESKIFSYLPWRKNAEACWTEFDKRTFQIYLWHTPLNAHEWPQFAIQLVQVTQSIAGFVWSQHFLILKITNPSKVLASSHKRPSKKLTSHFQVYALRGTKKCRPIRSRQEWSCRWSFANNWTVLALEEVLISICLNFRVKPFRLSGKT